MKVTAATLLVLTVAAASKGAKDCDKTGLALKGGYRRTKCASGTCIVIYCDPKVKHNL